MSCFIGGLKSEINHEVCAQRQSGIMETYCYAKVYEKAANARLQALPSTSKPRQYNSLPHRPTPLQLQTSDRNKSQLAAKAPNLYWYRKEPLNRQHNCRIGKTIHILQEVEEESNASVTEEQVQSAVQYHSP